MKNEFTLAFNEVLEEKQLPKEIILQALESAMVSAYRRAVNASNAQLVEAKIDPDSGQVTIYAEKEVVEESQDERTEVTLEEARKVNPNAELGSMVLVESTPKDFGRVAAQTARQVIQQRIRDAERQSQLSFYEKQLGEIVSGVVQAVGGQGLTIGLEMKAEGTMPRKEMIGGERFRIHDRVRALISEVKDSQRGPQIILSRTHRNFLRRLLENEVPEIYHGVVEIRSIAREPGQRAKVAVSAAQAGIDPVGACVGIRGVRIQAIVRELHDEKIDVIEWSNDPAVYIAKAISPARVSGVYLNEQSENGKTATVVVPEDQLSLAIGRDGQNARLAAKLTGWRIDIKSLPEAASDALNKLSSDETYMMQAEAEHDVIPVIEAMLVKKADGRPLPPEEYDVMTKFVDRVERRAIAHKQPTPDMEEEKIVEVLKDIPTEKLDVDILDSGLPEHVTYLLQEANILTVRDLAYTYRTSPDSILKLQGIGPRAMQEIQNFMSQLEAPAVVEVPEPIVESPIVETPIVETTPVSDVEMAEPVTTVESVEEPEEEVSFDQLFSLKSEALDIIEPVSEEDDELDEVSKKSGKKKKPKHVEVTYDPDRDMTTVIKKHKRGGGWDWDE
ncbi:transcription termination factor NusA [Leptolinea tardivitalis]|uniref:transcription termination factor NusA n=1 Tax=Leptolinea tardivitalis TaxID=229920 RepID=UPI0009D677C0|nr:transcription termination factor NusA [Leptolinea tardivitalis]GAP21219.1 NusA antitermination factor [Leptolinea tardivitalis]